MQGDTVIWMVFLILCMISVIEVYSATSTMTYSNGHYWDPVLRHSAFLGIGIIFAWLITQVSCNWFKLASLVVLAISILLLIVVLFTTKINGGARWLEIGRISFQPSELAKMGLIGFTAFVLSTSRDEKGASKIGTRWVMGITGFVLLYSAYCSMHRHPRNTWQSSLAWEWLYLSWEAQQSIPCRSLRL